MKQHVEPKAKSRPERSGSTFKTYLYQKGLSTSTVSSYYKHAVDFLAWLDGQNIETENVRPADIAAYIHHLRKKELAGNTINWRVGVLKLFFDYQVSIGGRKDNPAGRIKIRDISRGKLYTILSMEELGKLYNTYRVPDQKDERSKRNWFLSYRLSRQRNKTIIGLMVYQGLTTAEINRLTVQDVKLREGKIYIAGSRKSAERELDLKPWQIIELMDVLQSRHYLQGLMTSSSEAFFLPVPASGKTIVTGTNGIHLWKRLSEELRKNNPRFINFKQVRTSVITHWLGSHNLRMVQYMAGHKYVSTTEAYRINQVEDLQADIEKYYPL